jgi:hypothetical protein
MINGIMWQSGVGGVKPKVAHDFRAPIYTMLFSHFPLYAQPVVLTLLAKFVESVTCIDYLP